ncbi:twitching motility protein PilT [Pseudomonas tohonis]|uniref:Ribonuclease VapC n=1 Tax=Pseudomonas tohonis TaxID=2725477 RepID=A0A6J4EAM4_9PSED|nr:type II toxin-antitoxin system VapC family toxin [Pseudomonas tohonis]BCG26812.1 twitching motility protein PilT [Pseudomonas tohonis]GJN50452.1 twitching motility protein PilT [Pseudomonas tohonis]
MFLLDTNVVSELRKARQGRADQGVVTWAGSVNAKTLYLSAISLMELETGVLGIERKDAAQGALLRTWLNQQVLPGFAGRVLAVDATVALACARLHVPDRKSERDALIAATALVHGLTVVTRNLADFEGTGVPLINPWSQG